MSPKVLTEGLQFPEGPVWAPDGTLYVTEIGGGRIVAIAPNGSKRTFADTGGAPNGAALGSDGYLYVTNNGGKGPGYIQRIDAQAFRHLVIEKAFARAIRLYPLAINHELRNGALARALDDFLGSSRRGFDIDFGEREVVLRQKTFGRAAIGAPERRVDFDFHDDEVTALTLDDNVSPPISTQPEGNVGRGSRPPARG